MEMRTVITVARLFDVMNANALVIFLQGCSQTKLDALQEADRVVAMSGHPRETTIHAAPAGKGNPLEIIGGLVEDTSTRTNPLNRELVSKYE